MTPSDSLLPVLAALLLFTSFIKITTALTVFRYGIGLTGIEFGVVCLLAAFGLSITVAPPELAKLGLPTKIFASPDHIDAGQVTAALIPYMQARIDPEVAKTLATAAPSSAAPSTTTATGSAAPAVAGVDGSAPKVEGAQELRTVAPAFIVSELKAAVKAGCMLLIPFVVIDLLIAHLLVLVGIQQIGAQTVALPIKLLLFLAVDGWGLLIHKLLAT